MAYHRSLDYLFGLQKFGIKLGLDNIRTLLARLDSPERRVPIVHVAGTNGKGSTCVALAEILQGSGYRVGLFTSPHLHDFTERIQIDRQPISTADVVTLTDQIRSLVHDLPITFFEFTTAMALEYFRRQRVDVAILETGLGGRLDATNAVLPILSVITPISHDHQAYLGDNLTMIAAEKGAIIKPKVPVCVGRQEPEVLTVLEGQARSVAAPLFVAGRDWQITATPAGFRFVGFGWSLDLRSGLAGEHQQHNLGLAVASAARLRTQGWQVDPEVMAIRLARLHWPGRLEWWPTVENLLLDAAHNLSGSLALAGFLEQRQLRRIHLLVGFKADKDWRAMLTVLLPFAVHVYVTEPEFESVVDPQQVVEFIRQRGGAASWFRPAARALDQALMERREDETLVVAGSLFLVSAIRTYLIKRDNENF